MEQSWERSSALPNTEVPVVLALWGKQSTPLLPSLPGPLWPGVVASDMGPMYGLNRINAYLCKIELFFDN